MKFRVKTISADTFDKPNGAITDTLALGDKVTATGPAADGFIEVKIDANPPAAPAVWMREADLAAIDPNERLPVHLPSFIGDCINDERTINDLPDTAPWYVYADFEIARAEIMTGITNPGPAAGGSDEVGPLRVGSVEWKKFRSDNPGGLAAPYDDDSYDHYLKQIIGATYRMRGDAKAISAAQVAAGAGSAADPFLPSYLDLFHAYLLNPAADDIANAVKGALAILKAEKADPGASLTATLAGLFDQGRIDAMLARPPFKGQPAPATVGDFVAATESALGAAFKKAFDLVKQHAPEELPQLSQAEAPWYDVALSLKGLDEHVAADAARIKTFFAATDFGPVGSGKPPAWCGAFAAHCLAKSGSDEARKSIPKGAAVAANWKGWGDPINFQSGTIPVGAVVVMAPGENTGTSGHVGFFARSLGNGRIELLGGNQGDKSQFSPFQVSKIAYVGWLNLAGVARNGDSGVPASNAPIAQAAIDLIVAAEIGSRAQYDRLYHKPVWPKGRSGVTIGIGYDIGYATPSRLQADWTGRLPAAMIDRLVDACGRTGKAAAPLARQMAGEGVSVPFDKAMQVFLLRDVPRWVGIVLHALPKAAQLGPTRLGVLVSLAYNRGASFAATGDRYAEMNRIRELVADGSAGALAQVPDAIRSMKRLWPDMKGLRDRRDAEAALWG